MSYKRKGSQQYGYKPRRRRLFQVISLSSTSSSRPYSYKWQVRSHSDPSKHYVVSLRKDGVLECSCPQWIYRRKECKHIQEVRGVVALSPPLKDDTPKQRCPECGGTTLVRDHDTREDICAGCGYVLPYVINEHGEKQLRLPLQ